MYVVHTRVPVRCLCGTYFYLGEDRHRWGKFQSRNGDPNDGCRGDGMGHGVFDPFAKRHFRDQQKKLALSDPIGTGDGGIVALLLSGIADRRRFQGRSDRQAERSDHLDTGIYILT